MHAQASLASIVEVMYTKAGGDASVITGVTQEVRDGNIKRNLIKIVYK